MNASKENCRKARNAIEQAALGLDLAMPGNKPARDRLKVYLLQVDNFLEVAETKLPTEASFKAELDRRKQRTIEGRLAKLSIGEEVRFTRGAGQDAAILDLCRQTKTLISFRQGGRAGLWAEATLPELAAMMNDGKGEYQYASKLAELAKVATKKMPLR